MIDRVGAGALPVSLIGDAPEPLATASNMLLVSCYLQLHAMVVSGCSLNAGLCHGTGPAINIHIMLLAMHHVLNPVPSRVTGSLTAHAQLTCEREREGRRTQQERGVRIPSSQAQPYQA